MAQLGWFCLSSLCATKPLEGKNRGAEVSIDLGHTGVGTPGAPHVGWQTPGKKNTVGHIFLDDVNINRSKSK